MNDYKRHNSKTDTSYESREKGQQFFLVALISGTHIHEPSSKTPKSSDIEDTHHLPHTPTMGDNTRPFRFPLSPNSTHTSAIPAPRKTLNSRIYPVPSPPIPPLLILEESRTSTSTSTSNLIPSPSPSPSLYPHC